MVDWYNNDWEFRFKVTSDNTQVAAAIKGLAIDLSNAPTGFWSNVNSDGADIRVTQSDGTTEVARDVVSIDTGAQKGLLRIDSGAISTSADTDYYVYYGNASADEPAPGSTYGQYNAYETDTELYYGAEEGSGSTTSDRTSNENNGTLENGVGWSTNSSLGKSAFSFSGSDGEQIVPSMTAQYDNVTLRATIDVPSSIVDLREIIGADERSPNPRSWQFRLRDTGIVNFIPFVGGSAFQVNGSTDVRNAGKIRVAVNYNGSVGKVFVNGLEDGDNDSMSGALDKGGTIYVGADPARTNESFDGLMDEVFIDSFALSNDQLITDANCELDNASFWTFGAPEEVGEDRVARPLSFGGGL